MIGQDYDQLTLFQGDSHASRLVLPGSDEARKMTVTSGRKCLELYRRSGPLGSLAKMLLGSYPWRSTRCYLTWKASATPAKRLLFRLVLSTPRIDGTGAQWWPTPTAGRPDQGMSPSQEKRHTPNLAQAAQIAEGLWPTPTAQMGKGPGHPKSKQGSPNLQTEIGGQLNPDWVEWLMGFPVGWTSL